MSWTPEAYQAFLLREHSRKKVKEPPPARPGVWEREADLHQEILEDCRRRQWPTLHGSTAHPTKRTPGEPDILVLCEGGRVLLIEVKVGNNKLSLAQACFRAVVGRVGHDVHLVRSFSDWLEVARHVEVMEQ